MSIKIITDNKKARFDYSFVETYEAGIVLKGSEVKSARNNQVQLKDSYVAFSGDEAFLMKAHIAEYKLSSYNNHEPERKRKLLLHREELNKIRGKVEQSGLTCVPTKMYFKGGMVKVEIAIAKGKKKEDKREDIKKRDVNREIAARLRRSK